MNLSLLTGLAFFFPKIDLMNKCHQQRSISFTFPALRKLGPHLFDALQHHVAVPVEGLDAAQQLFVVPETENI